MRAVALAEEGEGQDGNINWSIKKHLYIDSVVLVLQIEVGRTVLVKEP